jgi:gluconokinase
MILILMGVTGSGKTTVGKLLSARLGWLFEDADWYHPVDNITKMCQGVPLTDEDRSPWLDRLHIAIRQWIAAGENVVLACSALKHTYRTKLAVSDEVWFAYLKASQEVIASRLSARQDHFMNPNLLSSQFDALEEPAEAIVIDATEAVDKCVEQLTLKLAELQKRAT